ncbi:MAG TPA: class I SAM-dependent methyltransferase [Actinomycetales bacterium]|nr:class I SAM-dependent methyltransferase [Actinomycetales bacterium]
MRLRPLLSLLRAGDLLARLRALRDGQAALRVAVVGSAIELGVLDALRQRALTSRELADKINVDDVTQLSAYLSVLESVGQVSSDGDRWRLAKAGRAVLADDLVSAAYQGFSGYHVDLYRGLPAQLRGGPPRRDIEERGEVIARLSTAFEPFVAQLLADLVTERRPRRVLDVGCGAGAQLIQMLNAAPGAQGVGVETDAAAAKLARSNLAAEGLAARATVLEADIRDTLEDPDLGGSVDLVLLANVIYYLPVDERAAFLQRLTALLNPGGAVVVVSTVAAKSLTSRHFDLLLRAQQGEMELPRTDELLTQLRQAGLRPGEPQKIALGEPLVAVVAEG